MTRKNIFFQNQLKDADLHSKQVIFLSAFKFLSKPSKEINRKDLKIAKKILTEIENWEVKHGKKDFSMIKNNSILVAYLAYKFGELLGLEKKELSDLYISGLVHEIGKTYICSENRALAYEYINSSLKKGDAGFEKISEALKLYPRKTKEYLNKETNLSQNIVDISSSFHLVYSNLFKEDSLKNKKDISQVEAILWFANSLSAVSFSSLEGLQRNYSKDKYVSLFEGLELLRQQAGDRAPEFWDKTSSGAALMGVFLTVVISFLPPQKISAKGYGAEEVISLLNEHRGKEGLEPLNSNEKLTQAAMDKARDMIENDYWSHHSPSGESPWEFVRDNDYKLSMAGENLARGFDDVEKMSEALLNSPKHRENILEPKYEDVGIAVVDGVMDGKEVTLVVQLFGKKNKSLENDKSVEEERFPSFKNLLDKIRDILNRP